MLDRYTGSNDSEDDGDDPSQIGPSVPGPNQVSEADEMADRIRRIERRSKSMKSSLTAPATVGRINMH